jgi:hypothetical protein
MQVTHPAHGALRRGTYEAQGYLCVPDLGLAPRHLDEVRALIDPLFDQYGELSREFAHDIAPAADGSVPLVPEINHCTILEPKLLETQAYAEVELLARELLGRNSRLVFDHAIYKPPGKSAATSWHQDSAFSTPDDTGVAIWMPLQPTSVEDGCMRYVPYSHRRGHLKHDQKLSPENKVLPFLSESEFDVTEAVSVPLELGAVSLHDRKTIHGAWPNVGSGTRRAWITLFEAVPLTRRARIRAGAIRRKL